MFLIIYYIIAIVAPLLLYSVIKGNIYFYIIPLISLVVPIVFLKLPKTKKVLMWTFLILNTIMLANGIYALLAFTIGY
ncbi:MAG: hypothetical protein Q8Q48_02035 [Candidatus Staskawiczbacteria bacterium]|nr:hypothetical protein [Candidatus Staskawiczbacteria bacterium]